MQHVTTKAAATTTDQGVFSALAATYSVDRVGDRIIKGAFENTIAAWQASEKQVPVHWDHEGAAASVIGSVDPNSMEETEDGLYVEGRLDLKDSETAREAWRSMKDNRVALSFGYLATRESKAKDGVNELLEIDLFEVSIVPAPANPDTRLLSLKGADKSVDEEQRRRLFQHQLEAALKGPVKRGTKDEEGGLSDEVVDATQKFLAFLEENPDLAVEADALLKHGVELRGKELEFLAEEGLLEDVTALVTGKAVWTTAYINDLPDSAFLCVESGEEGKSLRHFPYKDASGAVDLPHLRNALARIPQSDLSREIKDRLVAKAQRLLENAQNALSSVTDAPKGQKSDDLLRKRTFDLALEMVGGNEVRFAEPVPVPQPEPLDEAALRRKSDELALEVALS